MAHELAFIGGSANIAYTGQTPWHGLGKALLPTDPLQTWAKESGTDFSVKPLPLVYFADDDSERQASKVVLTHSASHHELGIVSSEYNIFQPADVWQLISKFCEDYNFLPSTAGVLFNGSKIWALCKSQDSGFSVGHDRQELYALVSTSFDGSSATQVGFTGVRVVCNNTLSLAYRQMLQSIRVSHRTIVDHGRIFADLGLVKDTFEAYEQDIEKLALKRISNSDAMVFILDVLSGTHDTEKLSTRALNIGKDVFNLFNGAGMGSDLSTAKGTLWGAVNAVTQYIDHNSARNQENRLNSAWLGKGNETKTNAMNLALSMAA